MAICCKLRWPASKGLAANYQRLLPISVLALTNILLMTVRLGLFGVQNTDMDFLSLENSRVNSFFMSCFITCKKKKGKREGQRWAAMSLQGRRIAPPSW